MIRISRHTHLALLLLPLLALFSSVAIASRGRTANLTDADGSTTTWTFDALNHNTSVTVPGQGTTSLTYFPSGLSKSVTRPDAAQGCASAAGAGCAGAAGSSTATSYDTAGRIAGIVHSKGDSELAHENYTYDLDGNRITQKESNGAVTGNVEQTTTYSYDTADRLTDVQAPDRTTHYVLDTVGNRTVEQITDTQNHPIGNSTLSYDARDELTQRDDSVSGLHITLAYDLDGNTLSQTDSSGTRIFGYDANDRLLTLTQPGQLPLTFDYQSDGQRIAKHQGNTETRYQYDQNSLLAETNAIGNTLTRYHYSATQLISRSDAGSTPTYRHYLLDALKTPVALLTQDGAISARTSYDAWGEIIAQQGTGGAVTIPNRDGANAELPNTDQQDVGYTGYLKDSESGLYYAKARYYDPRTARFTTQDPEDGKAMQPPSLHRYLYAYANPTVYVDPTGRQSAGPGYEAIEYLNPTPEERAKYYAQIDLGQRGATKAVAGTVADTIVGGVKVIGEAAALNVETYSLGLVNLGARERIQSAANTAANFLSNDPISQTQQTISNRLETVSKLSAAGDTEGTAEAYTRLEIDTVSATTGAYGLMRGVATGLGRLAGKIGAADAMVVTERASGDAAAALLERKMQLNADNDFGPINQPTHQENLAAAGDRVVSFGGPKMLQYNDRSDATFGGQGSPVWGMSLDDAAQLRTRSDVVTQTGHAPSVANAYAKGDPIYGVSVPTDKLDLRLPTENDGGNNHWRVGGYSGVEHDGQWTQNPTHEFVADGGKAMPADSVLFEFNSDGSWTPIRRF